jgi:hypothetical protein
LALIVMPIRRPGDILTSVWKKTRPATSWPWRGCCPLGIAHGFGLAVKWPIAIANAVVRPNNAIGSIVPIAFYTRGAPDRWIGVTAESCDDYGIGCAVGPVT